MRTLIFFAVADVFDISNFELYINFNFIIVANISIQK